MSEVPSEGLPVKSGNNLKIIIVVVAVLVIVAGGFFWKTSSDNAAKQAAAEECVSLTEDTLDALSSMQTAWEGSGISPEEAQSGTEEAEGEWSDVRDSELKGACKQVGAAIDDAITDYGMVYSTWSDGFDECYYDYYCTEDPSDYGWITAADYMNSGGEAVDKAESILAKIESGELSAQ